MPSTTPDLRIATERGSRSTRGGSSPEDGCRATSSGFDWSPGRRLGHMASNGTYQIVRLLPSDGDDYQYRIKSAAEAFERVAKESQLDTSR